MNGVQKSVAAVGLSLGLTFGLWLLRDILTPANISLLYLLLVSSAL